MATHRQAGHLALLLVAITMLPVGLAALWRYPIVGVILTLAAMALTTQSIAELHRIKSLDSVDDS